MPQQHAVMLEPEDWIAKWIAFELKVFAHDEDWSRHHYGGVYLFVKVLTPDKGRRVGKGGLATRFWPSGDAGIHSIKENRPVVIGAGRSLDDVGSTKGCDYPLWWPLYISRTDDVGEAIRTSAHKGKAIEEMGMTHVHVFEEPDEALRERCFQALFNTFVPDINRYAEPRYRGTAELIADILAR